MKKILAILSVSLMASVNAYAAIQLGEGNIGNGLHYPVAAELSIDAFKNGYLYDVTCKVMAVNGKNYPVTAAFQLKNAFSSEKVYFDGVPLNTYQKKVTDNKEHTVKFINVGRYTNDAKVVLAWIEGEGIADPFHYNCFANASSGFAK